MSQAEIWLEVFASAPDAATPYLAAHNVTRRDEIEPLPAGFDGFWIAKPANIITLVHGRKEQVKLQATRGIAPA